MSFNNKATVIYKVWTLDVWGNAEDGFDVNDRREAGVISVKTDRHNKSGSWDISNKAIVRALVEGNYLRSGHINDITREIDIDGEDDGVLNVDDNGTGEPLFQLEYERHHDIEEPSKGLFGEPVARESKENPLSSLSTGETVALVAAGVVVVGGLGYWLYSRSQSAQSAQVSQAQPAQLPPIPGTVDQVPPFVPSDVSQPINTSASTTSTGGQVYDPFLGGSGAIMPSGG